MSTGAGILWNTYVNGATSSCLLHRQRSRLRIRLPPASCVRRSSDARQQPLGRRGMLLIGLGGLCGVAAGPMALGKPVMPWDLSPSMIYDAQAPYLDGKPTGDDAVRYNSHATPLRVQNWDGQQNLKAIEAKDEPTTEQSLSRVGEFGPQPRKLDAAAPLRVLVPRPKKNRTKAEKEQEVEVLQISDIEVEIATPARFDVYVAAPRGDLVGPGLGEFAGTYLRAPGYAASETAVRKARLKLGLNSVLDDINGEDAEKLMVTLVLRSGIVTIGGIAINLFKSDTAKLSE